MGSIKGTTQSAHELYQTFEINQHYDGQYGYGVEESHFGNGNYPPDWTNRRELIWWLQDDRCARCGEAVAEDEGNVHHVQPLSEGGSNAICNLVGLCFDCHSLIHPTADGLSGDYRNAPKYPCKDAEESVAVVRKDRYSRIEERGRVLETDLSRLANCGPEPDKNRYAAESECVYDIGAQTAKQLANDPRTCTREKYFDSRQGLHPARLGTRL